MSNRREVREAVLMAAYAEEVGKNPVQEIKKTVIQQKLNGDPDNSHFAEKSFYLTVENKEEYDNIISEHINNWEVNRLAIIDKLILRIAVNELLNFENIPTKVTINEAIELAKNFSTRKSGKFVNGILDAILSDLNKKGRIVKKGRGLVETSDKK